MKNIKIQHIGIILDGNRRFAKRLMKQPWKGHEWGAKKLIEVLHWCREIGIKYVTIYSLSLQNIFNRPKMELEYIFKIFRHELQEILEQSNHDAHKYKIRIKAIGRLYLLPKDLQKLLRKVEISTKKYKNYFLDIAVAYGGQEEITDAVKRIAKKVLEGVVKPSQINEELVRHSLYTNGSPYPDLVIRTGGEKRLSNFLLWQSAYSELVFVDKMWPELSKKDFLGVIKDFQTRERRFGH